MSYQRRLLEQLLISSHSLDSCYADEEGQWDIRHQFDNWVEQVALALKASGMDSDLELWEHAHANCIFQPGNSIFDINGTNFLTDLNSMKAILNGILARLSWIEGDTDALISMEVLESAKRYVVNIAAQANGCFANGWYDACAVMIRRLLEVLIIECFDEHNIFYMIKTENGSILPLSRLTEVFLSEPNGLWHVEQGARPAFRSMKNILDSAAHGRYRKTTRQSLERYRESLEIAIQQLVAIAARGAGT